MPLIAAFKIKPMVMSANNSDCVNFIVEFTVPVLAKVEAGKDERAHESGMPWETNMASHRRASGFGHQA